MTKKAEAAEMTWMAWSLAWDLKAYAGTDEEKAQYERAASLIREAYETLKA